MLSTISASSRLKIARLALGEGAVQDLRRFNKLSAPRSHSKLATTLHQFGWELGNTTTTQAGQIRYGKIIAVQATAAGRRKTRGKGKEIAGCPLKGLNNLSNVPSSSTDSRYFMPTCKHCPRHMLGIP